MSLNDQEQFPPPLDPSLQSAAADSQPQPVRAPGVSLYRASSLGTSFFAALSHLVDSGDISQSDLWVALLIFDAALCERLTEMVKNKVSINGSLVTYRHCENVWNLVIENAKFTGPEGILESRRVKIVACESKNKKRKLNEENNTNTIRQ